MQLHEIMFGVTEWLQLSAQGDQLLLYTPGFVTQPFRLFYLHLAFMVLPVLFLAAQHLPNLKSVMHAWLAVSCKQ
jgi:hypothetical protein